MTTSYTTTKRGGEHRHAFLIMAHNNWSNLERIMLLLDKPWVDFYIHIDKKVIDFDKIHFSKLCKHASVDFVHRTNVKWGNESQIKAEMTLFNAAYKNGPYWYYHFLSGNDLPLKSASDLYSYFENTQENFLQISDASQFEWRLKNYINVFRQSWIPTKLRKRLNSYSEILQYKLKTNRLIWLKKHYTRIAKGHNWCDLTHEAVKVLINAKKDIATFTRFTHCSDELYKQIVILSNPLLASTISPREIRYILWEKGANHPRILTEDNYNEMFISGEYVFARKFDEETSRELANKIYVQLIEDNVTE